MSTQHISPAVVASAPAFASDADAVAWYRAENERLRLAALAQPKVQRLSLKVSDKGAISVYGMGRFPVTLYRGQWEALLGMSDAIKAFIAANADKLSSKADKAPATATAETDATAESF